MKSCVEGSTSTTLAQTFATATPSAAAVSLSQLPHKSVNLSFTITNIKNKLTDLCVN